VSNLSTYVAGALAAVLVMDHVATIGNFRPAFELPEAAGEFAEPSIRINRGLKGDRWAPVRTQRDSRPVNAPLEVVDFPTGSTGGQRSVASPGYPMGNVTAVVKREMPTRDEQSGKRVLPLGCESAFGRLAAPPLAHVLGRCII